VGPLTTYDAHTQENRGITVSSGRLQGDWEVVKQPCEANPFGVSRF